MTFDVEQYLRSLSRFGIKPGLERIKALLSSLGHPQNAYRTVHIGGTNGKGSIAAVTASVLMAAGYRVGLYTSPHLIRYNERIQVDGQAISSQELSRVMHDVSVLASQVTDELGSDPTEFEVGTAVAFQYFKECKVDVAVIEVGLGGRLDSTNVLEPTAVALGGIALDHTGVLGNTLEMIAHDKTGIFRPGRPAVIAPQDPVAHTEIEKQATNLDCPLVWVRDKSRLSNESTPIQTEAHHTSTFLPLKWTLDGGFFDLETPWGTFKDCHTPLLGYHQIENAATAITLALCLKEQGLDISESSIRRGLQGARWPGRLQLVQGAPRLLLDGVHNHHGALSLAHALKSLFGSERIVFLMAILAEKDSQNILQTLLPLGDAIVFTEPQASRIPSTPASDLAEIARQLGYSAQVARDLPSALAQATKLAGPDGIICVCGSLYLVGEMLSQLPVEKADKENGPALP